MLMVSRKNWLIQKVQIVQIGTALNLTNFFKNYMQNPIIAMHVQNPNLGTS